MVVTIEEITSGSVARSVNMNCCVCDKRLVNDFERLVVDSGYMYQIGKPTQRFMRGMLVAHIECVGKPELLSDENAAWWVAFTMMGHNTQMTNMGEVFTCISKLFESFSDSRVNSVAEKMKEINIDRTGDEWKEKPEDREHSMIDFTDAI